MMRKAGLARFHPHVLGPTLLLVILCACGMPNPTQLWRWTQDPVAMEPDKLDAVPDDTANIYAVRIRGTSMFDLRTFSYDPSNGRSIPPLYYYGILLLENGNQLLIITSNPIDTAQLEYTGTIRGFVGEEHRLYEFLMKGDSTPDSVLFPLVLDTIVYRTPEKIIRVAKYEIEQRIAPLRQYLESLDLFKR